METLRLLNEAWIHALGWTLVHSLWQGAAIALPVALLMPRLKHPLARYWCTFGSLLLLLAAACVTCAILYTPSPETTVYAFSGGLPGERAPAPAIAAEQPWWLRLQDWFEAQHTLLVGLWLTGCVLLLLRMLGGLLYLRHLTQKAQPITASLLSRAQQLGQQMGFRAPIRFVASHALVSPAAFGWWRPVVLFPIGLLNQLSIAETEAILAHELAHLVRRDWAMNLLQVLIEALFYYHPVVWWLSGQARIEREKCCDLMAVSQIGGDRLRYAKALLRVQEYAKEHRAPQSVLALQASGPKQFFKQRRTHLSDRMQLILLQPPQQKSLLMERMLAATLLLVAFTLWGLQAAPALLPSALDEAASWIIGEQESPAQDTVPKPAKTRNTRTSIDVVDDKTSQRVKMETRNGVLSYLSIDGKEIPAAEYPAHSELTNRLLQEIPPPPPPPAHPGVPAPPAYPGAPAPPAPPMPPGHGQVYFFSDDVEQHFGIAPPVPLPPGRVEVQNIKDADGTSSLELRQGGEVMRIQLKEGKIMVDGKELPEGSSLQLDGMDFDHSFEFNTENIVGEDLRRDIIIRNNNDNHNRFRQQEIRVFPGADERHPIIVQEQRAALQWQQQAEDMQQQAREMQRNAQAQQVELRNLEMDWAQQAEDLVRESMTGKVSEMILRELKRDGLVTNPNQYSLELNAKKMKVNGKKMPAVVHNKYKALYQEYTGTPLEGQKSISFSVSR